MDDTKRGLEIKGCFATGFIDAIDDIDSHLKSGSCRGTFDQLFDQRYALEDDTFASARDMRKDTVLNRIVL